MVEPGRPKIKIWRMLIACWVPKTTDIYSECVISTAFTTTAIVARSRLNIKFIRTLPVVT
jgi:hypothetical protein